MNIFILILVLLSLQACRHPLAIEGEGDIIERLTGHRGCTLEEFQAGGARCTENEVVDEDYIVSYQAVPRPGWRFVGWSGGTGCTPDSVQPYCDYHVAADVVNAVDENFADLLLEPTVAVFVKNALIRLAVRSKANGGFGPVLGDRGARLVNPSLREMVVATQLAAGQIATISAAGEINIATNHPSGGIYVSPEGEAYPPEDRPHPLYYFPLEETAVDAGDLTLPITDVELHNIGALIGAFVAREKVDAPGFLAMNDDPDPHPAFTTPEPIVGGIPAESLFLVGEGPFEFTAPENGTLFLGINDGDVTNNVGKFRVSITVN